MKTNRTLPLLAALLCAFAVTLFFTAAPAIAQDTAAAASPLVQPDTAAAIAAPFIVGLAAKYPIILTVVAVMGAMRFFFKPLVSLVEAYVKSTPATNDDELYDQATHSAAFRCIAWALDFFASVKVGPQFTAQPKK